MSLRIKLSHKLSQSLVMTPQLRQAINMLQLGREDCLAAVENALLENPVLEAVRLPSEDREKSDEVLKSSSSSLPSIDRVSNSSSEIIESTLCNNEGLFTHLMWQLRASQISTKKFPIGEFIIGSLDSSGYLRIESSEIARECSVTIDEVEEVVRVIQTFDPPGVASRNLQECLLIQIERSGEVGSLAWILMKDFAKELENSAIDSISNTLNISKEEILNAISKISKLSPNPASAFDDDTVDYIIPDVYVRKNGSDYEVFLNESGIPDLAISSHYSEIVSKKACSREERSYLKDKIKSANWLIRSIEQRLSTIKLVTTTIVENQIDFFDKGVDYLRPLTLREVARQLDMHESTISRVTSNKYVHTSHGIFELKYFFSGGYLSENGLISVEAVKKKITDLVLNEPKAKPLSDMKISSLLLEQGLDVARRTVSKYREELGIPPSNIRKLKVFVNNT